MAEGAELDPKREVERVSSTLEAEAGRGNRLGERDPQLQLGAT